MKILDFIDKILVKVFYINIAIGLAIVFFDLAVQFIFDAEAFIVTSIYSNIFAWLMFGTIILMVLVNMIKYFR